MSMIAIRRGNNKHNENRRREEEKKGEGESWTWMVMNTRVRHGRIEAFCGRFTANQARAHFAQLR